MTIAFDIDGTITQDPTLFVYMMDAFQAKGWTVIIVTGALQPGEKLQRLGITGFPIINSGNRLKQEVAMEHGYMVNVWVDDQPGTIQPCKILSSSDNL